MQSFLRLVEEGRVMRPKPLQFAAACAPLGRFPSSILSRFRRTLEWRPWTSSMLLATTIVSRGRRVVPPVEFMLGSTELDSNGSDGVAGCWRDGLVLLPLHRQAGAHGDPT